MLAKQKQSQYRENQIGTDFIACPPDDYIRLFINGEILTAENFPDSQIFINYKFTLPNGWKAEVSEEVLALGLSPTEMKELNCLESITQTVAPVLRKNQSGGVTNVFYFSFPIDIQLIGKQKAADDQWPILNFEVFEKDSWDRIYMQGCGFVHIPQTPGLHVLETKTWKPNLDYRSKVFQFFLGGLVRPKSIQSISKSSDTNSMDKEGPINRSLFNTISSGKITTRLNLAIQSQKVKKEERINFKAQKFSQQTEQFKEQYSKKHVPSQINTGNILGARYANTKLNV